MPDHLLLLRLVKQAKHPGHWFIMLLRLLLVTLAGSILPVASTASPAILILGDSISSGYGITRGSEWVALLKQRLQTENRPDRSPVVVVNASISGDTTDGGLRRLPTLLRRYQPAVTVIELGGNDGLRGFPLSVIERNLAALIKLSRTAGSRVLLLGMRIPPNYGRRYSEAFHAIYLKLQQQHQVALVPFLLAGIGGRSNLMQADGIHPNRQAQPMMLRLVWPVLDRLLSADPSPLTTSEQLPAKAVGFQLRLKAGSIGPAAGNRYTTVKSSSGSGHS